MNQPQRGQPLAGPYSRRGWSLSGFVLWVLLGTAYGGLPQYSSRLWQTDAGLPHANVQAIVQTRDGYLWVGTQYGLVRFNGIDFTVFDTNNVKEMLNPNILSLHEGRDGSLWIGTGTGGVLRLQGGRFRHYGKAQGLASDFTRGRILQTRDGAVWFGTVAGISRFLDGRFTNFNVSNGLSDNIVRDFCEDLQGNLWITTDVGLDCWTPGQGLRAVSLVPELKGVGMKAICCDREGSIWFGAGNKLNRLQQGRLASFSQSKGPPYNILTRLYCDRQGNLWVGSHGGLSRFMDGQFAPQVGSDGFAFDLVNDLCEDQEDNLWVGSKDGLTQLRAKRVTTFAQAQGLANNNVMSVLQDRAGTMWLGTWGGGLHQVQEGNWCAWTPYEQLPMLVLALHEDHAGRLWVGADLGRGLDCLSTQGLRHFGGAEGLPDGSIRVVYEDAQTNLWVGTSSGLYRDHGGRFRPVGRELGARSLVVRDLHQDRAGNLWVATLQGLWQLHHGCTTHYTEKNGLANNAVIALHEDRAGVLWIGTAGGGLGRLAHGAFTWVSAQQGLFHDIICEILEDDQGWFWFSCPRGVFRVNRQELEAVAQGRASRVTSIVYGAGDGMLSELCNGVAKPGAWKSRDGRLWFATSKGVSVIDPRTETNEKCTPPKVVLERVLADKQPFPVEESLPLTGPIRVPPGRGELEFHYAALSFRAPERNVFKYQLVGVDADWVEAGSRRTAYYHHIGPGKYQFRVRGRNNDSGWNEAGPEVEVVLLPQIWQTAWFRLLLASGIGLGTVGVHWLRRARQLEVERLRLRLAADLHDEVGSNLSTISLLSRRAQKEGAAGATGKEDLAAINRISLQTADAIREIVWVINPEYDTAQDLILRMREAAQGILIGMEYSFRSPPTDLSSRLPLQFRQDLFLLYKEILTNIARHSRGTRVEIDLAQQGAGWLLTVRDNGVGFEPAAAHRGNGLKNLRLRAARLRGSLSVESYPGRGTTVSLAIKSI